MGGDGSGEELGSVSDGPGGDDVDPVEFASEGAVDIRSRVAEALERVDAAAQLVDEHSTLVWSSTQLREIAHLTAEADTAEGRPVGFDSVTSSDWNGVVSGEAVEALATKLHQPLHSPVWDFSVPVTLEGRRRQLSVLGITLRTADGAPAGTALVYAPQLPAHVVTSVSHGDPTMLRRMVTLTEPSERCAAIVFVDIDSSTHISRTVSPREFFDIIQAVTTTIDRLAVEYAGIVGGHAGDGASVFFLPDHSGTQAAAAFAAIHFARALPDVVARALRPSDDNRAGSAVERVRIKVGAHWGVAVYVGQVSRGGRLEVTALGEEVNEAARIQEAARGGEVLLSRSLVNQLTLDDARQLGLGPSGDSYELIEDRGRTTPKVRRDVGKIPVIDVGGCRRRPGPTTEPQSSTASGDDGQGERSHPT